jgi:hypothetical protein
MRIYDASIVNEIANIPEVSRELSVDGEECEFDFSDAIASRSSVFLHCGGGVGMFFWSAPRVYECHILFPPDKRGANAFQACLAMRDEMMGMADMLWGQPKLSNRKAICLIRRLGFSPAGIGENPIIGPVQYLVYGGVKCHP